MKQIKIILVLLLVFAGAQAAKKDESSTNTFDPPIFRTATATGRPRGSTYTGEFVPISINTVTKSKTGGVNGRNVIIPPRPVSSTTFGEKLVPVFRTEAAPNSRLSPSGVIDKIKSNGKGVEPTLFVGIGSNPKRTEDFMQQSRVRETTNILNQARDVQKQANLATTAGERATLQNAANSLKQNAFSANGQTVKTSQIPLDTARKIISSSVQERPTTPSALGLEDSKFGMTSDVKNVDVTKSHNQFGVKGQSLQDLKAGIAQHGVQTGTTYGGRRRSEPTIKYTPTTATTTTNNRRTPASGQSATNANKNRQKSTTRSPSRNKNPPSGSIGANKNTNRKSGRA